MKEDSKVSEAWRKRGRDNMRTSGMLFFLALAQELREYYFEQMADCSRRWDAMHWWGRTSLTKIDNVLASDKVSRSMRALWHHVFRDGGLPQVETSQGLAFCMRLLFLEDVCLGMLTERELEVPTEDGSLRGAVERLLSVPNYRTVEAYLTAVTTKVWQYIGPDWLMARLTMWEDAVEVPAEAVPTNFEKSLVWLRSVINDILYDGQATGPEKAHRLRVVYADCLK